MNEVLLAPPVELAPPATSAETPERPWGFWLAVALTVLLAAACFGYEYAQNNLFVAGWTMVVGAIGNASCALLGVYLVLRRLSLLGDAISHAVLPGIALAFLFTGEISGLPILLGAMAMGILTTALTQMLQGSGRVSEDASLGVVYTGLFSLGVLLITHFANRAHLDAGCVLYGAIEFVSLDTIALFDQEIPRAFITMGVVLVLTLIFIIALWKELLIVSFDPDLAKALGLPVLVIHYALMAMVAGATVAAFEAVGSILVVAMLIVPAATAQWLTQRLSGVLGWAVIVAVWSALLGYELGALLNTSVAGMMSVVAGTLFAAACFFAPQKGLVSRWWRNLELSWQIVQEDLLARLYRQEEQLATSGQGFELSQAVVTPIGQPNWLLWLAVRRLKQRGLILPHPVSGWKLAPQARATAASLVRSHRLWESYLDQHFALPLDHLHEVAERMEHYISPALQSALQDELQGRTTDPHGREIPKKD